MDTQTSIELLKDLVSPGLVATVIAVTQAILMLASPDTRERMNNYLKIGLAILVGASLPPLGAYMAFTQNSAPFPESGHVWFFLVLFGLVNGVIAAGTVSMGFKVVKNVRARVAFNSSNGGTYASPLGEDAGRMIE